MQAHQLACVLLLCFTCGGLCTDADQEQRALDEELLSGLLTSKMKQNKQSAPYWRMSLANLCRLVSGVRMPWQEAWSGEEEEEELGEGRGQSLEGIYDLQRICRVLQLREDRIPRDSVEYMEDGEQSINTPLKRKSPYILKRQVSHNGKSRRPYILKRSTYY